MDPQYILSRFTSKDSSTQDIIDMLGECTEDDFKAFYNDQYISVLTIALRCRKYAVMEKLFAMGFCIEGAEGHRTMADDIYNDILQYYRFADHRYILPFLKKHGLTVTGESIKDIIRDGCYFPYNFTLASSVSTIFELGFSEEECKDVLNVDIYRPQELNNDVYVDIRGILAKMSFAMRNRYTVSQTLFQKSLPMLEMYA